MNLSMTVHFNQKSILIRLDNSTPPIDGSGEVEMMLLT